MVDNWLRIRNNVSKSDHDTPLEGTNTKSVPPETQYIDGHMYVHVAGCSCPEKMENLNPSCEYGPDGWCMSHTPEYHDRGTCAEGDDNCRCFGE